jgi:uncharacterized integral membrane protein
MPTNPTAVLASGFNTAYDYFWPTPVLRDLRFERLCKLARAAHANDLRNRAGAAPQWQFAAAVLELRGHPMSWLLRWAGIRSGKAAARWDRLLLVTTAIFVVALFVVCALALSVLTDGQREVWKWTLWILGGCVYGALIAILYFAVRRYEARQRARNIEKYRSDLPVGSSML